MKATVTILMQLFFIFAINSQTPFELDISNGLSFSSGKFNYFSDKGFNSEVSLNKTFCNNLGLTSSLKYSSFSSSETFQNTFGNHKSWSTVSFLLGPSYTFGKKKINVTIYQKMGPGYISTPFESIGYNETPTLEQTMQASISNSKSIQLNSISGLQVNFDICDRISVSLRSEYFTLLNSNLNFKHRNVSRAITQEGTINTDILNTIHYETQNINISGLNFNLGFRVSLENSRKSNYKSKRLNNESVTNKLSGLTISEEAIEEEDDDELDELTNDIELVGHEAAHIIRQKRKANKNGFGDLDKENATFNPMATGAPLSGGSKPNPANHNTTRSNRTQPILVQCPDGYAWNSITQDCVKVTQRANHNTTRSNRTQPILVQCPDGYAWNSVTRDCVKIEQRANHNTTRSNRTQSVNRTCPDGYIWSTKSKKCIKKE